MTILCWYFGSLFDSQGDLFGDFTYFAPFQHLLYIIFSHVYIALRGIFSYIPDDAVDWRKLGY